MLANLISDIPVKIPLIKKIVQFIFSSQKLQLKKKTFAKLIKMQFSTILIIYIFC